MDHTYIEENQVVDRYVMGKLPPDEAGRFEDHYLSCPECLDRLELAESLQRGFKRMAGQEAAVLATARQLAVVAWLARLGRSRQMAVLAMTVLVLAILPGIAFRGLSDHGQEQIRTSLRQERQRVGADVVEHIDLAVEPVERDPPIAERGRKRRVVGEVGERGDALPAGGLRHRRGAYSAAVACSAACSSPCSRSMMRRAWITPVSALMSICGGSGIRSRLRCWAVNTATSSWNAV